jgi:hypothetical protein
LKGTSIMIHCHEKGENGICFPLQNFLNMKMTVYL